MQTVRLALIGLVLGTPILASDYNVYYWSGSDLSGTKLYTDHGTSSENGYTGSSQCVNIQKRHPNAKSVSGNCDNCCCDYFADLKCIDKVVTDQCNTGKCSSGDVSSYVRYT